MELAKQISLKNFLNSYLLLDKSQQIIQEEQNQYLELKLPISQITLRCGLKYFSLTGRHQYTFPVYQLVNGNFLPLDSWDVIDLILAELKLTYSLPVENIELFMKQLQSSYDNLQFSLTTLGDDGIQQAFQGYLNFALSEGTLIAGHQYHPTPKSCFGFSRDEYYNYYPELKNSFQLHYFVAKDNCIQQKSAVLADNTDFLDLFSSANGQNQQLLIGSMLLPLHPWQANYIKELPAIKNMLADGRLIDLGARGEYFTASSSIRSVYSHKLPYMFKLSLNVMITNSVRMNYARELERAIAVTKFWQTEIAYEFTQNYPLFQAITDPAYLCLHDNGVLIEESALLLRENPFMSDSINVSCLAALCQDNPKAWGNRFNPLLWLFSHYEIALEAHQQNLLLELDLDGMPIKAYYRDSQGYYISEQSSANLVLQQDIFKHFALGSSEFVAHHFSYYLLGNSLLGVINALGYAGYCSEKQLVNQVKDLISKQCNNWDKRINDYLDSIINNQTLPFKDNLGTRLNALDELTAPLSQQSVYVDITNPFYSSKE